MNLPDAPVAREGFFVRHFFRIPATSSSPTLGSFSIPVAVRRPTSPRSSSKPLRISTEWRTQAQKNSSHSCLQALANLQKRGFDVCGSQAIHNGS